MKIINHPEAYIFTKIFKSNRAIKYGVIMTSIVTAFFVVFFMFTYTDTLGFWLFAISVVTLVVLLSWNNKDRRFISRKVKDFKSGLNGEEIVTNKLKEAFDDSWTYIRNYKNKNLHSGDIDGILVGPHGVFLLEVKNWPGEFHVSGKNIYKHRVGFYPFRRSPIKQLEKNEAQFIKYCNSKDVSVNSLRPFVVLINSRIVSFSGSTGIFITNEEELVSKISSSPDQKLSNEQVQKIIKIL